MGKKNTANKGTAASRSATTTASTNAAPRAQRSRSTSSNGHSATAAPPRAARRAAAPSATAVAEPPTKARAPRSARPNGKPGRNGHSIRIDTEQIALRAYFISERRRHEGRPGDPAHDWIIAEKELIAEVRRS